MVIGGSIGELAIGEGPSGASPRDLYAQMLERIDALEKGMAQLGLLPAAIGHNRPQEDEPLTAEDRAALADAIAILRSQPPQPAVRPADAVRAAAQLRASAWKLGAYLAPKVDEFISEFVKAAGAEAGKRTMQFGFWVSLYLLLMEALQAATTWLQALPTSP